MRSLKEHSECHTQYNNIIIIYVEYISFIYTTQHLRTHKTVPQDNIKAPRRIFQLFSTAQQSKVLITGQRSSITPYWQYNLTLTEQRTQTLKVGSTICRSKHNIQSNAFDDTFICTLC